MYFFCKKLALILLMGLPITCVSADPSRDKLIAVYIFRLAEHIQWRHAADKDFYHFHIIDSSNSIADQLKGIARIRKSHGKNFRVTRDSTDKIPKGTELVFIANNHIDKYQNVFDQTENQNILLISDNLKNDRYSLIDLRENSHNQISFQVNKANILNRNLGINPDIILLGGTEIDIAELYREGLKNLHQQNNQLFTLKQDIASLITQSAKLDADLTKARNEIKNQNRQILLEKEYIKNQKTEANKLKKQLQTIMNTINEKNRVIQYTEQKLSVLNDEIVLNTKILNQKNQQILMSTEQLEKQGTIISYQKTFLHLFALVGVLAILLLIVTFLGYRNKKISNDKLQKYSAELVNAKKIAEQNTRAKSKFLSSMSHELRSPLTSIIGFSHLVHDNSQIPDDIKAQSKIIIDSADYLLALINDVLDIAKIESGQIELKNIQINFINLIRDVENMAQINAEKKGLILNFNISPSCPSYIFADASKIRRIFVNLINNAIKFTYDGSVTIRIQGAPVEDSDQIQIHCEVEDTGIGIEEDQIDKIFLPFEQLVNSQDEETLQQGTGLGLSLSKQLIEHMQGSIRVNSTLRQGSVFIFSIIVSRGKSVATFADNSIERVFVGMKAGQKTVRALVADDLNNSALYLKTLLENYQCEVKSAANGKEAVEIFKSWQPDIIWMDIRMPVLNGIEATKIIRQLPNGQNTKIIAITASVFHEDEQRIMQHGFNDFIKKPYLPNEIRDCLTKNIQLEFIYQNLEVKEKNPLKSKSYYLRGIQKLPQETKQALEAAIMALDIEKTTKIIEEFKVQYPDLAISLEKLIKDYEFNFLQSLIRASS